METRAFTDADVELAGSLLAERHRRHRTAEPLLPEQFAEASHAAGAVEAAWRKPGAVGAVSPRADGYLVAAPADDTTWGANAWIELAGHAVRDAELVRDLYAAVAERLVAAGRRRHYVLAPASEPALLDAWYRLGFGQQQAHGIREVEPAAWPAGTRNAEAADLDELLELAQLISRSHAASPVFSDAAVRRVERWAEDRAAVRSQLEDDLAAEPIGTLVADVYGRLAGFFELAPVELGGDGVDAHGTLARPERACYLAFAATVPELRGSGTGLALTQASFAWAHEAGYRSIVTDWRVTNLVASRFWPRRGFRTSFLRLYRSIP